MDTKRPDDNVLQFTLPQSRALGFRPDHRNARLECNDTAQEFGRIDPWHPVVIAAEIMKTMPADLADRFLSKFADLVSAHGLILRRHVNGEWVTYRWDEGKKP